MSFTEEEQTDSRWRLREEILLSEVERDILAKLHEMVHLAEVSAAQYVEQKVFEHHYKAANKQYHSFSRLVFPYGTDSKTADASTAEALFDIWKKEFGDPNSEEVKKTIELLKG